MNILGGFLQISWKKCLMKVIGNLTGLADKWQLLSVLQNNQVFLHIEILKQIKAEADIQVKRQVQIEGQATMHGVNSQDIFWETTWPPLGMVVQFRFNGTIVNVMSSTNGELDPGDPGGQSNTPITPQPEVEINDETKCCFFRRRKKKKGRRS